MRVYKTIELKTRRASTISILFALVIAGFLFGVMQSPHAATPVSVSIDFVGNGTSMGAAEIAGVVPKANWNNATGATRSTPLALKDETGASCVLLEKLRHPFIESRQQPANRTSREPRDLSYFILVHSVRSMEHRNLELPPGHVARHLSQEATKVHRRGGVGDGVRCRRLQV